MALISGNCKETFNSEQRFAVSESWIPIMPYQDRPRPRVSYLYAHVTCTFTIYECALLLGRDRIPDPYLDRAARAVKIPPPFIIHNNTT